MMIEDIKEDVDGLLTSMLATIDSRLLHAFFLVHPKLQTVGLAENIIDYREYVLESELHD